MNRRTILSLPLLASGPAWSEAGSFTLTLRSRRETAGGSGRWETVNSNRSFEARKCALVLCDMWDKHWCRGATGRVNVLVGRAVPVIGRLRQNGVLIIHAPSDTMEFYRSAPQRAGIMSLPRVTPAAAKEMTDPPLPVDSSDGGCDTDDKMYKAWSRQHPGIPVEAGDYISDNGEEIYSALRARGITTLFVAGVHTNMCILNRSFAIRQMTKWGMPCILIRDLTDAMYDPKDAPFVSHDRGTELVVEHIERYWAPTATSADILKALPQT